MVGLTLFKLCGVFGQADCSRFGQPVVCCTFGNVDGTVKGMVVTMATRPFMFIWESRCGTWVFISS